MLKKSDVTKKFKINKEKKPPSLNIRKIGVVSRNYQYKFKNGFRDFSNTLPDILSLLDKNGCDTVLFSLFGIISRESYNLGTALDGLKNIKVIFLEYFQDGEERHQERFVTHHLTEQGWSDYEFKQAFGTITGMSKNNIEDFINIEFPQRIMGNACVLLCGETNGVKYSPKEKAVFDSFSLRASLPKKLDIILNPIHDRMTRFEMKLKRKFLSEHGRWVVSVWNKGKKDKNGDVKDGYSPAWTAYYNGQEISIPSIEHDIQNIEIGILDLVSPNHI